MSISYPIVGYPDPSTCERIDLGAVPFIRRCHRNGIAVDREVLYDLSGKLSLMMDDVARQVTAYVPQAALDEFTSESLKSLNIDSPDQIASLLYKHLHIGRGKQIESTKSGTRLSTGKKQLEKLKEDHPIVGLILKRREYAKLKTTYSDKLPKDAVFEASSGQWVIHTTFGMTFTTTGRLNSRDPNLQQIPFRSELGQLIRAAFIPRPGKVFISHDYSQIELRMLAHVANERRMTTVFKDPKGDIHISTACGAFDIPRETFNKETHWLERLVSKTLNFLIVFDGSAIGLQQTLAVAGVSKTVQECEGFIAAWFDTYPDVQPYKRTQYHAARRYGMVWTLWGFSRLIPEVRSVHRRIVAAGDRQAGNVKIQGSAAQILKIAMSETHEFGDDVRSGLLGREHYFEPLLTIHDQLIHECDPEIAEEVSGAIQCIMEECVQLRVPLKVDWSIQEKSWLK